MSIEITIKQKLFGSKTMPLEVILGNDLSYGFWENDQLTEGKLGETEFIAYDPNAIARGFSVIWNPDEKKAVTVRLPQPSTNRELRSFYDAVERMAVYWGGALIVDGTRTKLSAFLSEFDNMVDFNDKIISHFTEQILNGENQNLTFYSAKWPLTIGLEEAERIHADHNFFAQWLHERQSMDVFFCNPRFFVGDVGIFGQYMLMNDLPTVFPVTPSVPFGMTDPATGKSLECSQWRVALVIEDQPVALCEIDYADFLRRIPENHKTRYDETHFLLSALTEGEIRSFTKE